MRGQYTKDHTKRWAAAVAGFDGFIFVTPEYNHGPAPALVNAIDFLGREWADKAAAFVSYGAQAGGVRAVEPLRSMLAALNVATIANQVNMSLFTEFEGFVKPTPSASKVTELQALFDQLPNGRPRCAASESPPSSGRHARHLPGLDPEYTRKNRPLRSKNRLE
jgi:NAD(P)H-dependent FMN reductase